MSYSVVLLGLASEAVLQTAMKRAEERLDGGEPQVGIGEVLVDIAVEEEVPLVNLWIDRQTQRVLANTAKVRAMLDDLEREVMAKSR